MKRTSFILAGVIGLFLLALAIPAFAEDKGKEITITGDAKCGKCAMKETEKCQNVIQVDKDGKKATYYLVQNDVSKKFHGKSHRHTPQGGKKRPAADSRQTAGVLRFGDCQVTWPTQSSWR